MKSVPISVRVSQDEAETLARLNIPGATTPSEKLRHLIGEVHHKSKGPSDYPESIFQTQQWLAPLLEAIQSAETRLDMHSDIVLLLHEWLPDFLARTRLAGIPENNSLSPEALQKLESIVADRLFRLMERTLQLALISRCRCYDPELLAKRMDNLQQLAALITKQQANNKEKL